MYLSHRNLKTLACIALLLASQMSFACRPLLHHMSEYVQNKIPASVVFVGTVVSVQQTSVHPRGSTHRIEFRTTRWLAGAAQKTVMVQGVIDDNGGSSCAHVFDFSAQAGQEWLIFGQLNGQGVRPDNHLSVQLINGQLPAKVLEQLKQQGISF